MPENIRISFVTKKALKQKVTLPKDVSLECGKDREELGELEGRAYKTVIAEETEESTSDRLKVEWVVRGKKGSKIKLIAKHERAGVVRSIVVLK